MMYDKNFESQKRIDFQCAAIVKVSAKLFEEPYICDSNYYGECVVKSNFGCYDQTFPEVSF